MKASSCSGSCSFNATLMFSLALGLWWLTNLAVATAGTTLSFTCTHAPGGAPPPRCHPPPRAGRGRHHVILHLHQRRGRCRAAECQSARERGGGSDLEQARSHVHVHLPT